MTSPADLKTDLNHYSSRLGFSLFGIADIESLRGEFLLSRELSSMFPLAVSLGKRLSDSVLDDIQDHPTALYFHHYRQLNFFLDRGAFLLSSYIQDRGFAALPIPASQIIDWKKQLAHAPHKKIGRQAGLGWIGRNNLLVNPDFGSRIRLVTVLTDMPLNPDAPLEFGCGECRKCISVCPAAAIKEDPAAFDHLGCYRQLDDFRKQGLVSQHVCGVCVKACDGFRGKA